MKTLLSRLSSLLLLLALAATAAACGQSTVAPPAAVTQESSPTTAAQESAPAAEAGEEITYVMPGDDYGYPSPFTFYSRGPGYLRMSYLFDTLVWKDENGYVPWLAETWETSDDGATWTFNLRPDVRWHDGQPLTAEDVVFTFTYFKEKYEQGMVKWGWPLDMVENAEIGEDGSSVVVRLQKPVAGLLTDLFGSLPIIPKHIWEGVEDPLQKTDAEAVTGSGMFRLEEYNKEEGRYVYVANSDFFLGKPSVDRLIFIRVNDAALSLMAGEIDESGFSGKAISSVRQLEGNSEFAIAEGPSHWVLKLYINTNRPPYDQKEVRQAMAYAINREEIVEKALMGGGIVASLGILSPDTYWHNPDLPTYDFDPEKAKEILAAAGVGPFETTLVTTDTYVREAELIKVYLAEVGINVTIKTGDRTTVDSLRDEGDFDLLITGHGGIANPDMDSPTVEAAWKSSEYDALYDQLRTTIDDAARREVSWQMQAMIAEELPVIALWHPIMWEVYRPGPAMPFYTPEGVDGGIPTATNKLMFLPQR